MAAALYGAGLPRLAASYLSRKLCPEGVLSHVMEPPYPGSVGHYWNLGVCYDRQALSPLREELKRLSRDYKACYDRGYQRFRGALELRRSAQFLLRPYVETEKFQKRIQGILTRECKGKKGKRGTPIYRFLGGLTCQGRVTLWDTAFLQCKKVYELRDGGSGLADQALDQLSEGILQAGYDPVLCLSPEDPERLAHILVPQLSLAFVTGEPEAPSQRPYRRIHLESLIQREAWKIHRNELRFAWRIADELTEDGLRELRHAKALHDEMEAVYHPHVDFSIVDQMVDQLAREILAM